jgi:hypothetical protein
MDIKGEDPTGPKQQSTFTRDNIFLSLTPVFLQDPASILCEMADGRVPSKSGVNPIGIRSQHGHPSRDNPDAVLAAEFIRDTAGT